MDPKPYKVIEDLYKLFEASEGKLTDKQIGYITGCFKTLVDLYYEPGEEPQPIKKRRFTDLILGEK